MISYTVNETEDGRYTITMHFPTWEDCKKWQDEQNGKDSGMAVAPSKPDPDWIPWEGGENPFKDDQKARVRLRFREGCEEEGLASEYRWDHSQSSDWVRYADIVAYKITAPDQLKAETDITYRSVGDA